MVAKKKSTAKKAVAKKAPAKKAVTKKAVTKKAVAKKAAPKKAPAKKAAAAKPAVIKAISEPMNKTQLLAAICEKTELNKKDVGAVFDALSEIIEGHIKKRATGSFTLPGLLKVKTIHKPAQKARKGINPFTKEETTFKAKPARTMVKILPLKKMKDMTQ